MFTFSKKLSLVIISIIVFFFCNNIIFGMGESIKIYTNDYEASGGGVAFNFYSSGYSDGFWWGETSRHKGYGNHEMLCGEFGAAIAASNLGSQAIWFQNPFSFPNIVTNSIFVGVPIDGSNSWRRWNDPNNPINNYDTAQSVIEDNQHNKIRITIDYELVDLGPQDANTGVGGSPIAFRDANGTAGYVYSDACGIVLLTYSIKNISDSNVTDIEFYQMLCSLYYSDDYSSYTSANYPDPLSNYVPHNSVHKAPGSNYAGKFRYDVSQWGAGDPNTQHVDWISFSSTIPPTSFENDLFYGDDDQEPTTGTYTHIKNRSLNGVAYSEFDDPYASRIAGAMKWNLGSLDPNQTKKITIAVMFGCKPVYYIPPSPVILTKDDDIETCALPDSLINYSLCYDANDVSDTNVILIDYLPGEVDFNSCTGGGVYSEPNHTVTWNIGTMGPNDFNCFTLQVRLNSSALQGHTITNTAELIGGNYLTVATEQTNVCCLDNKVYVDACAPAGGNGQSWQYAYNNLQTALTNVRAGQHGCADQIWVAKGTYKPTDTNDPLPYNKTFEMISGKNIYGHFAGWEDSIDSRNLADSNNDSILSGDLNNDGTTDVYAVVTAANSRIDGFTIRKGTYRGISCNNCSPTISNCIVKDNNDYSYGSGIFCENGAHTTVFNTFVNNNKYGIQGSGSGTSLDINRCTVGPNNLYYGLGGSSCTANVTDCLFSDNTHDGISTGNSNFTVERCDIRDNGGKGIVCGNGAVNIQRCTIQRNHDYGIETGDNTAVMLSVISENYCTGITTSGSSRLRLINNLIYRNAYQGGYGVNINGTPDIRGNSIISNHQYDLYSYNGGGDVNVVGNIIWGNGSSSINGSFTPAKVNYNCIQGGFAGGTGNINQNPQFRNADVNDYHLQSNSPCIDAGDPNFNSSEADIDGEDRCLAAAGTAARVDIGADEFNPYDMSRDGFVDFADFVLLAKSWGKTVSASDYNDYYDDNVVNLRDLEIFCRYWLTPEDWQGIGGEGAYFAENSGGEEMMMLCGLAAAGTAAQLSEPEQAAGALQVEVPAADVIEELVDVEELIGWLDEIWQSGDFNDIMTEAEYEHFREAVEESGGE